MKLFSLLFWGPALVSTAVLAADETIFPYRRIAKRGKVSGQKVNVLSTLELEGTRDDWDTYIEMSAGRKKNFKVFFDFKLTDTSQMDADSIEELTIRANTIGLAKSDQRLKFHLRNFKTKKWTYIGDNGAANSWKWNDETFTPPMSSGGFSDYFNSKNLLRVQVTSNNNDDVVNIDYLGVTLGKKDDIFTETEAPEETEAPGGTDGGTGGGGETGSGGGGTSAIWSPKASDKLTWQWQLQGTLDTSYNVDMYDVDLFDTSAATIQSLKNDGRVVVCYFSAGTYEGWRSDWAEHFSFITGESYSGSEKPFAGNMAEWDERWLDIREIDLLDGIMTSRLELAIQKGCDAVEPDNMDAYTNPSETGVSLTYNDQLTYNRWLANKAHSLGVSIGLKNDVDQLTDLVDYFDWALNEQCFFYNECDSYVDSFLAKDKAVFGVEYDLSPNTFCPQANAMGMSWLKKRLDLKAYRIGCEDY